MVCSRARLYACTCVYASASCAVGSAAAVARTSLKLHNTRERPRPHVLQSSAARLHSSLTAAAQGAHTNAQPMHAGSRPDAAGAPSARCHLPLRTCPMMLSYACSASSRVPLQHDVNLTPRWRAACSLRCAKPKSCGFRARSRRSRRSCAPKLAGAPRIAWGHGVRTAAALCPAVRRVPAPTLRLSPCPLPSHLPCPPF